MISTSPPTLILSQAEFDRVDAMPVSKILRMVLLLALKDLATAVTFEPLKEAFRLFYRCSGKDYDMAPPPWNLGPAFCREFKILANLNVGLRGVDQEGRFKMVVGQGTADIGVAIRPTPHGESVHLSIDNNTTTLRDGQELTLESRTDGFCCRLYNRLPRTMGRQFNRLVFKLRRYAAFGRK